MNPMDDLERLEYCFRQWLFYYKEDEWGMLSTREAGHLASYHFNTFINLLRENTREGDYPFNSDKK